MALGIQKGHFCIKKFAQANYSVSSYIFSGVQLPTSLVCIILTNTLLTKVIFWQCKPWEKNQHNHTHSTGWCRVHLADWKQNSLRPGVPSECHLCHKKYVFPDSLTQCTCSKTKQKSFFNDKDLAYLICWPVYSTKRQKKLGIQKNPSTRITEADSSQMLSCLNPSTNATFSGCLENYLSFPYSFQLPSWFLNTCNFLHLD